MQSNDKSGNAGGADFATLIDAVRDLAEVHVLQRLIELDRVPVDGGDGPLLRLP